MNNKSIITLLLLFPLFSMGQNVTTFAGKVNSDAFANYESTTSGVALNNTFFSYPEGIAFDANGKMYIAERNKIRVVHGSSLYIRAGSLAQPSMSEGYRNNTSTQATFRVPGGMASDADGNMMICDTENHCIRKVSKFVNPTNNQIITTFAGSNAPATLPGYGTPGTTDGTGTSARFNTPKDIVRDTNTGFYFVTDYLNFTIRKISPTGVVTTLAGNPGVEGSADGTGSGATFAGPWGIAMLDASNLVVVDQYNTNIRKVNIFSGVTTTIAGPTTGPNGQIVDGTLSEARFKAPKGVAVVNGIIYVGDQNVIRAIDISGNSVTTFAGNASNYSVKDGSGSAAEFTEISDIVHDGQGNLYICENSAAVPSSVIRKMTINTLAPGANFTADNRNVQTNSTVTLTDISSGEPATSRQWSFDKTTYSVVANDLTSETVGVQFTATGFYEVTLQVTNSYGTDTEVKGSYISVSTSGIAEVYEDSDLVNVYPNPANNQINIDLDPSFNLANTTILLNDVNGNVISKLTGKNGLSTAELANGCYYLTVVSKDKKIAKKVMVIH